MPTKHFPVVTCVLLGIWWLSPTISAAEILEGPFTFQGHNKSVDVAVKCQKGMGIAKTVLTPEYKKHLNEYERDAGNVAEILLNRAQVQMLFKGNTTKLDVFQKVLDDTAADVKVEGVVNLIKQFAKVMQQRREENKLTSFLLSLKSVIDGDNHRDEAKKERFCECSSDDDCLNSHAMHFCSKCDLEIGACLTANYDRNGNCPLINRNLMQSDNSLSVNIVPNSDRVMSAKDSVSLKNFDILYPPIPPLNLPRKHNGPLFIQNGGKMTNHFVQPTKFPPQYGRGRWGYPPHVSGAGKDIGTDKVITYLQIMFFLGKYVAEILLI